MGRDALDHVAKIDDRIDLQATLAKWQSSLQCENYFISIPCASHERGLRDGLLEYAASATKPNILVIMGDDIGYWNISADNRGMMGYRTPNIDRIANEGAIFTDY